MAHVRVVSITFTLAGTILSEATVRTDSDSTVGSSPASETRALAC